jgi:hypothetical protein
LDFIVAREGETEPLAESSYSFFYTRGVSVELDLEAGNYVVLVSYGHTIPSLMTLLRALYYFYVGSVGSCSCARQGGFVGSEGVRLLILFFSSLKGLFQERVSQWVG